jgi:ElaA protein
VSDAPPTWSVLDGADLTAAQLYDVLALRSAVFVVEQECAYQDVDGLDLLAGTVHVLGSIDGSAAYARVLAPDDDHPTPRIGRVIVERKARGRQLARPLVREALAVCEERWPREPVELGAQAHLSGFYASLGFVAVSEPYDEDGIPHVWMRRDTP